MNLQKLIPKPVVVKWVQGALEEVPSSPRHRLEEAVAILIQHERERLVKLLEPLHTRPKENTGAWWRGKCPPYCKACEIVQVVRSGDSTEGK